MGRIRQVLKRVRGGVRHRHVEEASICAPATLARCHTRKAAIKRGLPGRKPDMFRQSLTARDRSVQGACALSFQSQIRPPRAIDTRHAEYGPDLTHLPPVKAGTVGAKHK